MSTTTDALLHHDQIGYGSVVSPVDSSPGITRQPSPSRFAWLVPLGVMIGAAVCLAGLLVILHPTSLNLASAELANTVLEGGSSSASTRDFGPDEEVLADDLDDYAVIHNIVQREYHFPYVDGWPELSVDLEREKESDNGVSHETSSLTVSWTEGKLGSDTELLDNDVVALQCGKSLSNMKIIKAVRLSRVRDDYRYQRSLVGAEGEAGTPRIQGRRTTEWFDGRASHGEWNANKDEWYKQRIFDKEWTWDDDNEWVVEPVPHEIWREPYCRAILCLKVGDLEYAVVAESRLLRYGHFHT
jgi:hypothetical protein